jgi:transposase
VEVKRQIVEETFKRGASVAMVARRHGVNANQLFAWRRQYQRGALAASQDTSGTVTLVPIEMSTTSIGSPVSSPSSTPALATERIEIEFGGGRRLSVQGRADLETLRAVIRELSQP